MTPPWRSALYLVWAITSFTWLICVGAWTLVPEVGKSPILVIVGTLWAGSFFVHLISKK